MNKAIIAIGGIVASLSMSACAAPSGTPEPVVTETAPAAPEAEEVEEVDSLDGSG